MIGHYTKRSIHLKSRALTATACQALVKFISEWGNRWRGRPQGSAVSEWVGEFLRDYARQAVLRKLQRLGAPDRHAFVFVSFGGAPWPVESYLMGNLTHLPTEAPNLSPPVTGVWVVSQFGHKSLRLDGGAWCLFEVQGEGIED